MHFIQAINSDISVLIVCNKTGGAIKGDIKKNCLPLCFQNDPDLEREQRSMTVHASF